MSLRDQINLLKKNADEVNSVVVKREMTQTLKEQWRNFYETIKAFAMIDNATLVQNAVDAQKQLNEFKFKLDDWKDPIKNVALMESAPKREDTPHDLFKPALASSKAGGSGMIIGAVAAAAILGLVLSRRN